jgi:hypothetical protein
MFGSRPPAPQPTPRAQRTAAPKGEPEAKGMGQDAELARSLASRRKRGASFLGSSRTGKTLLGE